ncbi:dephospho-CoA kinase [Arenimonas maotaiensis]|uniref:Dephospho-CoA kinase n=1 Tax=Arenimonas maotaiensis TaxID=1446479 RepID=A0A917CM05_9GAMM|nr:dephospho-CoA kinase [Arenimonas maotaiensis]GGF90078.1 dephospho-CoA kinase [Arenimonas maotaiensis]
MALRLAVSGGIAAGKSAVCAVLAECGAHIIDADAVARELVRPGQPALAEIAERLGARFVSADGLDRAALRAHVFADADAKAALEAILHPRIQAELRRQCEASTAPVTAVAIPLLTPASRAGAYAWLQRVLIVEAPRAAQVARIAARDGSGRELAEAMVSAQLDSTGRLPMADDVLINDGPLADLRDWSRRLYARYAALGSASR